MHMLKLLNFDQVKKQQHTVKPEVYRDTAFYGAYRLAYQKMMGQVRGLFVFAISKQNLEKVLSFYCRSYFNFHFLSLNVTLNSKSVL